MVGGRFRWDLRGATASAAANQDRPGALIRPVEFAHWPGSATVLFARRAPPSGHRSQGRKCGRGSVGRASPCQGEGRGFESPSSARRRRTPSGSTGRLSGSMAGLLQCGFNWLVRRKTPLAEWPSGLGKGLQSPLHGFDSRSPPRKSRAISSAGERFPDTEEVTGSIPVSPTHLGPRLRGYGRAHSSTRAAPASPQVHWHPGRTGRECQCTVRCGTTR